MQKSGDLYSAQRKYGLGNLLSAALFDRSSEYLSGIGRATFTWTNDFWIVVCIVNEQTGNLKLAQKFLGHSTIEMTTDIYTHTSAEAERETDPPGRAIHGDLFAVVPNFANGNNSVALN